MITWTNGTKVWCVRKDYGSLTLFESKEDALDALTRKDALYSFVVSDFQEEKS